MINIHSACRRAQLEEVKRYLEAGGDIEKKDTVSPRASPLSEACASGRVDIASLLLDNGANISHRDDEGNTPLHRACFYGYLEAISLLLERGAEVDIVSRNSKGETPDEIVCTHPKINQQKKPQCLALLKRFKTKDQEIAELKDQEIAELKEVLGVKDQEIFSLHQKLSHCEEEKNNLSSKNNLLSEELKQFQLNERILVSSHVRISSDSEIQSSDCVVDGVYHSSSSRGDVLCKVKLKDSTDKKAEESLRKELAVLWYLQNSSGGQSNQFVVRCLHSELVSSVALSSSSSSSASLLTTTSPLSLSSPTSNPNQFSTPGRPMIGLVLECGGPNLKEFIDTRRQNLDVIHRVHILRDVVNALGFLHDHHIVHGDLKPDNIVSFSILGEGMVRWKLVDFDQSHDLRSHPPSSVSRSSEDDIGCTPEYSAPELIKLLTSTIEPRLGNGSDLCSPSSSSPPPPLVVSHHLDIWSLGMVSVFALSGCTTWRLLYPARKFSWRMVEEWDEESLSRLMSFFGEKEKTFIQGCLKSRLPCRKLLSKSLFTTDTSTIQGSVLRAMSGEMNDKFEELKEFVLKLSDRSSEAMSDDLNDAIMTLVFKLEGQSQREEKN